MEEQRPMEIVIPKIKKYSGAMAHKINTDKLRDMLREVILNTNHIELLTSLSRSINETEV